MIRRVQSQRESTKKFTEDLPACWASACSRIRSSTRSAQKSGMASVHERSDLSTTTTHSFVHIAWEFRAAPVTSHRCRPIRRPIRKIRSGRISPPPLATNTSAKEKCSRATWTREASFIRCCPRNRRELPTLRASRPITSITRMRSMRSSCSPSGTHRRCTENMAGGTLHLPGEKATMPVPHILKDGADSIGVARRDDSRLRQHRDVLGILADAAQPARSG